jgi:hypothetical protein
MSVHAAAPGAIAVGAARRILARSIDAQGQAIRALQVVVAPHLQTTAEHAGLVDAGATRVDGAARLRLGGGERDRHDGDRSEQTLDKAWEKIA